jgi:small-conductance mechanosensitive channel
MTTASHFFDGRDLCIPIFCCLGLVLGSSGTVTAASTQSSADSTSPTALAGTAPGAAGTPATSFAPPLSAGRVIEVLDQTVDWQRTLAQQQQAANEPSDVMFLYDNRQTAGKVLVLAFEIARADADMLAKVPPPAGNDQAASDSGASQLAQLLNGVNAQEGAVRAQLDAAHRSMDSSAKRSRVRIQAKINELQGELELVTTRQAILRTMTGFAAGGSAQGAGDLKAQIDAMAVAIPSVNASAATATTPAAGTSSPTAQPSSAIPAPAIPATAKRLGMWDLASEAFKLSAKGAVVNSVDQRTVSLQRTLAQIRDPLIIQIQGLSAQGNALAARASSADSATLNGMHDQLSALAEQFKQASAVLLPLSEETLLLKQYRRNLANWHDSIRAQFRDALQGFAIRFGALLAVLALVFAGAELWRRAVLHYIQDTRRRYQLLLLRRIALWVVVAIIVGIAFASELGSIATFAGLITAGIAVAMQSVLVSIVGYFFLIGKYGIRVGDRIQIGEVAGEVIDLGLVRMYIMELGGKGTMGPTGRVVAFANSVVFQVSSGLFKQIAGVNLIWREVVLNLPAGANYSAIKERLAAAVTDALGDYSAEFRRQTQEIERTTSSASARDAEPEVRLQFAAAGVEAHVRYPVHLGHAAEIDERVTEGLARVMSGINAPA